MAPRRSHRKSRNGCPECKGRRLKCDERYPCTNCVKHAIHCSYLAPNEQQGPSNARSSFSHSPASRTQSRAPSQIRQQPQPPQPESYATTPAGNYSWTFVNSDFRPENRLDLLDILAGSPQDAPVLNQEDWTRDLELLHHYCTVTCNSLTLREDSRHVWRVVIPIEGYSNKYVMQGVLAIAALHRAYLYPAQKEKYIKASAYHQAMGLKEFRELISSPVDPSNWQPVFCFASMITLHVFALPIRLGVARWPAPIANMVEVFSVVRGFQIIMEPFLPSLSKSQLAPLANCIWLESEMLIPSPSAREQSLLPSDIWTQIAQLHQFIDDFPFPALHPPSQPQTPNDSDPSQHTPDYRRDYKTALNFFEHSTRQLELAGPHVETGMVLLWAYSLSKQFHEDLIAHRPAALILLAHFCVLLHVIDHCWFINGAGRQLLEDIERHIHPGFREWLVWPKRWVFER